MDQTTGPAVATLTLGLVNEKLKKFNELLLVLQEL